MWSELWFRKRNLKRILYFKFFPTTSSSATNILECAVDSPRNASDGTYALYIWFQSKLQRRTCLSPSHIAGTFFRLLRDVENFNFCGTNCALLRYNGILSYICYNDLKMNRIFSRKLKISPSWAFQQNDDFSNRFTFQICGVILVRKMTLIIFIFLLVMNMIFHLTTLVRSLFIKQ